jgi:hypothetical protein
MIRAASDLARNRYVVSMRIGASAMKIHHYAKCARVAFFYSQPDGDSNAITPAFKPGPPAANNPGL